MQRSRVIDPIYLSDKVKTEWDRIFAESRRDSVPIIGDCAAEILMNILLLKRPAQILEIGTGIGYSTYILFAYMHVQGKIFTIESNRKRYDIARDSFIRSETMGSIVPLYGDALEVCKEIKERDFDLIFIDAQKSSYCAYFDAVQDLVAPDGVIISDDVFFHSDKGDGYCPRVHRNTVDGLEKYRDCIVKPPWRSILFQIEDGISITWKVGG